MMHTVKHDHIGITHVYGIALISALLFFSFSLSIDMSQFGLVFPLSTSGKTMLYQPEAFKDIEVRARAYIVYDVVNARIIASKNESEPLPIASLTKVMTALTALTHYDKDTVIVIQPRSAEDGEYDLGLKNGQTWTLGELLKYTLVFSSNDGAHAIADGVSTQKRFVDLMNADSALLGLSFTFTDPAGLDVGGSIGGKGTALDVAKLFAIARRYHPEIMEATTHSRVTVLAGKERLSGIPNTNQEIGGFFGAEASKTGYTDIAGGNLGVVVDISLGHPVVIVVLGSTREERFSDVDTLYNALIKSLK